MGPRRDVVLDSIKEKHKKIHPLRREVSALEQEIPRLARELHQVEELNSHLMTLEPLYDALLKQSAKVKEAYRKLGDEERKQRDEIKRCKFRCEKLEGEIAIKERASLPYIEAKKILEEMRQVQLDLPDEKNKWIAELYKEKRELNAQLKGVTDAREKELGITRGLLSNKQRLAELSTQEEEIKRKIAEKEDRLRNAKENGDYSQNPKIVKLKRRYEELEILARNNDLINDRRLPFKGGVVSLEEPSELDRIIADLKEKISPKEAEKSQLQSQLDAESKNLSEQKKKHEAIYAEYSRADAEMRATPIVQETTEIGRKIDDIKEKLKQYGKLAPLIQELKEKKLLLEEKKTQLAQQEAELKKYVAGVDSEPIPTVSRSGFFSRSAASRKSGIGFALRESFSNFISWFSSFQKTSVSVKKPPVVTRDEIAKAPKVNISTRPKKGG